MGVAIRHSSQAKRPVPRPYSFTGHETFPFRYTWLPKGVRLVERHARLFIREDATVLLGVGKNMVKSIRHWCETLGLIERTDRTGTMRPTELGLALFGRDGWDPYLENPGTLWLLHWRLVSRGDRASTWYLAFTRWNVELFTREQLADWLLKTVRTTPAVRATASSIRRDVDTFLRTYTPVPASRDLPLEDTFDCPLVELGLIHEVEKGLYRFVRGPKGSLHDLIFVHSLLDYWHRVAPEQSTLSFETILHGLGAPGGAFKLSDNALAERLEKLPRWTGLVFDDTAGMRNVLRQSQGPLPSPIGVLKRFYARSVRELVS
jgi:hypothetical protein